jgi:dTDP-4-amino-4,6-dideoxygalactose transaminase
MEKKVAFLDLRVTNDAERQNLLAAVDAVLRHGKIVMGPEVAELESSVAKMCGRKYGIGVNSGTDALFLGLMGLGIRPGDEVITTSLSWIATANAIALIGAKPVFADISDDLNIDPRSVAGLVTPRTKAIMPVHYTGKIAKMEDLLAIAQEHKLPVVEDASQAFGAKRHGKLSGTFGDMACFSMNPMKVFAACGEAGMILTDSDETYNHTIALRYNGTVNRETCIQPSHNGRLDTMQAAILLRRIGGIDAMIQARRNNASQYARQLSGVVEIPKEADGEFDVYYTYQIRTPRRDELKMFLEEKGIETKIQHPILMPDQPAYREYANSKIPNARRLVSQILCLPIHEKLTEQNIDYVCAMIRKFFGK